MWLWLGLELGLAKGTDSGWAGVTALVEVNSDSELTLTTTL